MDRFELVEKLVKSTGVSYEDAKIALETSGWDLLDAAVWLEKNGRIAAKTGHFTTDPEQQQQQAEAAEQQRQQREREETARRNAASQTNTQNRGVLHSLIRKIRGILMDNEFVVCKNSGEIFLELPIWLIILLLILAFWPTVIVLILVFILGFRFRFHGPDLGVDMVHNILNRAENSASDFIGRVKNQYSGNHGNSKKNDDDVIDYKDPYNKE